MKKSAARLLALFLLLLPLLALFAHAGEKKAADKKVMKKAAKDVVALKQGLTYLRLGNDHLAIEAFSKAIELNPKLAEAYSRRGGIYYKLGDHERGVEDTKAAARLGYRPARRGLKNMGIAW